jgi:hypothetical protein
MRPVCGLCEWREIWKRPGLEPQTEHPLSLYPREQKTTTHGRHGTCVCSRDIYTVYLRVVQCLLSLPF